MLEKSVPTKLNFFILCVSITCYINLLYFVEITQEIPLKIIAIILFAYIANTIFCLLHESVHGIFSNKKRLNEVAGIIASFFLPTSFTAQRHFHLGHHDRNRSDLESWDVFLPDDNRFMKRIQWYMILTGLYWTSSVLFCFFYLIAPFLFKLNILTGDKAQVQRMGIASMLEGLPNPGRIRLEIIASLCIQFSIIYGLDLSFLTCLLCYGCFAWMWSSLQYANHAFTVRDKSAGAWNLKVFPWTRYFFLNYHHHLVHHLHPKLSWVHLPDYVDNHKIRPSFWTIYLKMWLGPKDFVRESS